MSDPVIELKGLKKDYGNGRGVFDVSFSVERGEVFGFLGPNGAGKTVTMRNLMGFIRPDEGTVSIDGLNCFSQRSRIQERLGYLPGEIASQQPMSSLFEQSLLLLGDTVAMLVMQEKGLDDLHALWKKHANLE